MKRRYWLLAVKAAVSAALIAWILRGTHLSEVFAALATADRRFVAVAFSLCFVGYFLSASRWRVLLGAQGVRAPLGYLVQSFMVSLFLNNLLPSTVGGDTIRVYDSWRVGGSKAGAVAVILLDRFIGLCTLMLFALGALVLAHGHPAVRIPLLPVWVGVGSAGMLAVLWMIFSPPQRLVDWLDRWRWPVLRPVQRLVDRMLQAFLSVRGRRDALAAALGLSFLLQTNVVVHYYFIARALGFPVPFAAFFWIVPLAILVMMIPVSINAIGLRESAFAFFLAGFGVSRAEAVAFAWIAYGFVIIQGLLGGIVYALRK